MTVPFQTRTTVGQLVYRVLPRLDFGRLAADLDAALGGCDVVRVGASLRRDGVAILDHGGSRVGIGLVRGLDGRGAAAVIVTVGYGPDGAGDPALARRQSVLARLIAQRIASRFPPTETLWTESDEIATEGVFSELREALVERRRQQEAERALRAQDRRAVSRHALETADVQRMFARLDMALDARRMGRPELALAGGPSRGMGAGSAPAAPSRPASAPLRLAAHMIDATLMVIALPVGVAMMIYSLARGGDVNTSARVMALSGTTIGLAHLGGSGALLQAFML